MIFSHTFPEQRQQTSVEVWYRCAALKWKMRWVSLALCVFSSRQGGGGVGLSLQSHKCITTHSLTKACLIGHRYTSRLIQVVQNVAPIYLRFFLMAQVCQQEFCTSVQAKPVHWRPLTTWVVSQFNLSGNVDSVELHTDRKAEGTKNRLLFFFLLSLIFKIV